MTRRGRGRAEEAELDWRGDAERWCWVLTGCPVPAMIGERSGPAQVSTHCPSAGPRVAQGIHTGGGLPNNAVHGGGQLRSMLGNERECEEVPWSSGKGSSPPRSLPTHPTNCFTCPARVDLTPGSPPILCASTPQHHKDSVATNDSPNSFLFVCSCVCSFPLSFLLGSVGDTFRRRAGFSLSLCPSVSSS